MIKIAVKALSLGLTLASCGGLSWEKEKKHSPRNTTELQEFYVVGNPEQLIEGATLNRKSFITLENFNNFNDFHQSNVAIFYEKDKAPKEMTHSEVEDENDTSKRVKIKIIDYKFFKSEDGTYTYQRSDRDSKGLSLKFEESGNLLELTQLDGVPVEVLHYSMKTDGSAISFLLKLDLPEKGKSLFTVSFSKSGIEQDVEPTKDSKLYLMGDLPFRWKTKTITLDICGDMPTYQLESIKASISAWANENNKGDIELRTSHLLEFPPFTDLNHQCLRVADDYYIQMAKVGDDVYGVAGFAMPTLNYVGREIVDSDLFIFTKVVGFPYFGGPEKTTMHEIGHFLGLGHNFEKDDAGNNVDSIMSYSKLPEVKVFDVDYEVLFDLYGTDLRLAE